MHHGTRENVMRRCQDVTTSGDDNKDRRKFTFVTLNAVGRWYRRWVNECYSFFCSVPKLKLTALQQFSTKLPCSTFELTQDSSHQAVMENS